MKNITYDLRNLFELIGYYVVTTDSVYVWDSKRHAFLLIRSAGELRRILVAKLQKLYNQDFCDAAFNSVPCEAANELFSAMKINPDTIKHGAKLNSMPDALPVSNGIICVDKHAKLVPFADNPFEAPGWFNFCLNCQLDGKAAGTKTKQFLHQFLGDKGFAKARDRFWELIGNLLFSDPTAKTLLWIHGDGDDGKSVIIRLLRKLYSKSPGAFIDSKLAKAFSRFGAASFSDARVVVLNEANSVIGQESVDELKRITGADGIPVEAKFKNIYDRLVTCKFIATSNHLPRFKPGVVDNALKNRCQFIQAYSIPRKKRSPDLFDWLWSERDYFVTQAVIGFIRLKNNGFVFTECEKDSKLKKRIFAEDPSLIFLQDCCRKDEDAFLPSEILVKRFKQFRNKSGLNCTYPQLLRGLANLGYFQKRKHVKHRHIRGISGLMLK